jgi:non-ribosomal peptide synthetase component F
VLNRLDSTIRTLETSALGDLTSEISVATSHDLQEIWHQNQSTYAPIERFIHHAIEEFAQKQPSSPAVCAWDGTLTYLELEKSSRNLASRLIDRGVTPGTIVPICFEKSMITPIIMLAVLKAGGAFLLLDASLPEQRLRQILSQAEANFVICSFANREVIFNITGDAMVVTKDALTQINSLEGEPRSCRPTNFNSPAYVIFTSGSTGVPKGVSISHKNVASAFLRDEKLFGCDKDSRIYDFASYSFTVSLTNFFMALTQGGCLCVPSEQERRTDFPGSFEALNSNTVITTPSAIASLSSEGKK